MKKAATARRHPRAGMVIAIPLPEGNFAFAKILEDIDYAIYDLLSKELLPMDKVVAHKVSFYLHGNGDQAVRSGAWPILGEQPFPSEEASHAPPVAIFYNWETDSWSMGGTPWIADRNGERRATLDEVKDLDYLLVDPSPESMVRTIVHRLVDGHHHEYKVRRK